MEEFRLTCPRTLVHSLTLALLVGWAPFRSLASASGPKPAPVDLCEGTCPVAFLQVDSRLRSRTSDAPLHSAGAPSPVGLLNVARTYLSIDPAASAAFWVKYLQATYVPLADCGVVERVAVKLLGGEKGSHLRQTLIFIKDPSADRGPWNATQTVLEAADMILQTFGPGQPLYTPWIDNHDGYIDPGLCDVAAMLDDRMPMQVYSGIPPYSDRTILRVYIPGTLWTAETGMDASLLSEDARRLLEAKWVEENPDYCRQAQEMELGTGWWKATYMSAEPLVAAQFAAYFLGGDLTPSDYPWPPEKNCTAAQWVFFPQLGFSLHFVLSKEWETAKFSIEEQVQAMSGFEALESGAFHPSMYNSLVFTVDSLDEYVLRLEARALPYMLMRFGLGQYALFAVIPGNAITVQLRSHSLSIEAPISESICAEDFGELLF